jgi:hypothetical protein
VNREPDSLLEAEAEKVRKEIQKLKQYLGRIETALDAYEYAEYPEKGVIEFDGGSWDENPEGYGA